MLRVQIIRRMRSVSNLTCRSYDDAVDAQVPPLAVLLALFELLQSFYIEDYVTSAYDHVSFVGPSKKWKTPYDEEICSVIIL